MVHGRGAGIRTRERLSDDFVLGSRSTSRAANGSRPLTANEPSAGLGLGVPAAGSPDQSLPCGIGWDGGIGTRWRSNPRSGVTGILLTQREVTSPAPPPVVEDFWAGVNAAIATQSAR
jgi:CubicO group peptidase (beta-lactamase class C family)